MTAPHSAMRPDRQTAAHAALILVVGLLTGCDNDPQFCTDEEVPGLEIQVVDDATGDAILCDLTIWVFDGDYTEKHDRLPCPDPPNPSIWPWTRAAEERSGTYTILVEKYPEKLEKMTGR